MALLPKPIEDCGTCALYGSGLGFSRPEGLGTLGVACFAEALGEDEERDGLPLRPYAQAGSMFSRILKMAGYSREQFTLFNTVNCFSGESFVRAKNIRKIYRRWYRGPILRVRTDRTTFTGTPNHPAFTRRGVVALKDLAKGDQIIYDRSGEFLSSSQPNVDYGPTRFDELFSTLAQSGIRKGLVGSSVDFHGDGMDSEIEVVTKHGLLRDWFEAEFSKLFEKPGFMSSTYPFTVLPNLGHGTRALEQLLFGRLAPSYGVVSGLSQGTSFFGGQPTEFDALSLRAVSNSYRVGPQNSTNGARTDPQISSNEFCTTSQFVECTDVLGVECMDFSGHVYNLETSCGKYTIDGCLVSNCRPPRNWLEGSPWESSAIAHCRVHRERVIDAVKPRVIIALGGVACRTFTGEAGEKRGISYLRGYIHQALRGYKQAEVPCSDCGNDPTPRDGCFLCGGTGKWTKDIPDYGDIYIMPTFHPSFIQRGEKRMIPVVIHDIKKAVELAQQLLHSRKPERHSVEYQTQPSLDQARSFELRCQENQGALIVYDIETPSSASEDEDIREIGKDVEEDEAKKYPQDYAQSDEESAIIQAQFSLAPYTGIAFPWQGEYIAIAKRILAMQHRKAGWNNSTFDDPRLRAAGCKINGTIEDFMWKWHHLQPDLPAGLQFAASFLGMDFPWKHLYGEKLDWYGCADVDAPQRADKPLSDALHKLGISRGYERHIVILSPILWAASDRGVPVNREKLAAFEKKITEAQEELRAQKIMPKVAGLGLGKIEPKDGLKTTNTPELKKLLLTLPIPEVSKVRLCHVDSKGKDWFYNFEQREFFDKKAATVDIHQLSLPDPGGPEPPDRTMVTRWCRHFEFNPGSSDQIKDYMRVKKHPIPKNFKEDKETTNKLELERLARNVKDPFYTDILEFRSFDKMRSTYCKGWMPKADGCVHTTWTFRPAIGQTSTVNPNIQNSPKHVGLAEEFRDCIEAPPGFKIVEFDYKSFFVITLGFESKDKDWIRLGRLDIHSYLTAFTLHLPEREKLITLPDDELRDRLAWIKKNHKHERDYKSKRAVLGYNNGMGYRKLYYQHRESFSGENEAKKLLDMLDGLFPVAANWRQLIKHQAQREYRLVSRHGYHRRFYDVLDYWGMGRIEDAVRRGRKVPAMCPICKQRHDNGEEAEAAIAYLPANDAFGHIKDSAIRLEEHGWNERAGFINTIHDSLMFMMPDSVADEAIPAIYAEMTKPSDVLIDPVIAPNGLVCDVEVSVGQTWRNLEAVSIKTGATTGDSHVLAI